MAALGLVGCADGGGPGMVDAARRDGGPPPMEDSGPVTADGGVDAGPGDAGFDGGVITDGEACSECGADEDCNDGMYCARLGTGDFVCLPSCNPDLPECPPRFDCISDPTAMTPEPVCAPVGERCCVDGDEDLHGMGVGCLGWDCDDDDPDTHESAVEICDGSNNDCDGATDEGDMLCPRGEHVARAECSDVGVCENVECELGWGDCDAMPENGCETRTDTVMHCGGCFVGCTPANATGDCSSGTCGIGMCNPGFGDCNGSPVDGCETALDTLMDCGRCGVACNPAFAIGDCSTGTCEIGTCNPRRGDCDMSPINGCETSTTSNSDCGGCGVLCAPSAAIGECSTGTCRIVTCTRSDYADCDLIGINGCETSTRTNTDCAGCGVLCEMAGGSSSCASGVCTLTGCSPGLANCDGLPGCEQPTNTATHCGDCNTPCNPANGTGTCSTGTCVITSCSAGFDDCDGDASNGCETRLDSLSNCGACGASCNLAHADESCSSGTCRITMCDPGWGNCDALHPNGCERPLNTLSDCGSCGTPCVRTGGTASCSSGVCGLGSCSSGRSDCDGSESNGCEVSHTATVDVCGSGTNAGTYDGDVSCNLALFCPGNTTWDLFSTQTARTDRWFRGRVHEDSNCSAAIEHRIRLTVPAGVDYDLYVYKACGGTPVESTNRGDGLAESVVIRESESTGTDDDFTYYVHVVYVGGAACVDYTLRFEGHDC